MMALILALILVESGGDDAARGDRGLALGCLQITPRVIEDVNRVYGTRYRRADCLDRQRSIEICERYLSHWGSKLPRVPTAEDLARIWNGGPQGWNRRATDPYWIKVRQVLPTSESAERE